MPKILIVDDESHIRRLLEETLEEFEDYDVEILTAANGKDALEIIKSDKPELVYLDVMMPEINGYDVCYEIKKELKMNEVHIVMLTAKGQEFDKIRGLEAGVDHYVTKPFDPDYIVEYTENILDIKV